MLDQPEYHENKLRELIVYIADRTASDPTFGATKLNKALYFSDFFSYALRGRQPITGAAYQCLPHGPAPRRLLPVRNDLLREGGISLDHTGSFPYQQTRIIARRKAQLEEFDRSEIDLVEEVVHLFEGKTAATLSDISHRQAGWQLTELGEDIPYQSVFVSSPKEQLSLNDISRGQILAKELGLVGAA